jgi:hypothetical protein
LNRGRTRQGPAVTQTYPGSGERAAGARPRSADELAAAIREQWRAEEGRRRIQDPFPLPVRWTVADPALSDDAVNIFRLADETHATDGSLLDGSLRDAADVFSRIPSGRLVVIGPPGAGRFLQDAHACGALRQSGASYQFRHARLQERLTARPGPSR